MARILITSGPTREPLDPVRYISNASSGKTGLAIAAEAIARGHEVILVLGPCEATAPAGATVVPVLSCAEMLDACRRHHPACDAVIGVAAVADFRPDGAAAEKRRREDGPWTIRLVPNPDILADLARTKGSRVHLGFALQTEDREAAIDRALGKLRSKGLDWIVLNDPSALGGEEGSYLLFGRSAPPRDLGRIPKTELARAILEAIENSLKENARPPDNAR